MRSSKIDTKYTIYEDGTVISNTGRILSISRDKYRKYPYVSLVYGRKIVHRSIHRLLALSFIDNPNNLPEVNHKDGNKANYSLDNLEWISGEGNRQHATELGLHGNLPGEEARNAVLLQKEVDEIRASYKDYIARCKAAGVKRLRGEYWADSIGLRYGVSKAAIYKITSGVTWKELEDEK